MKINSNSHQGKHQHYSLDDQASVRVAILSDTHAHLDSCIIEHIRGCDLAIHAGDIGDAVILDEMAEQSGQVIAVAGNNDLAVAWPHSQHEVVNALPEIARVDLPGGRIVIEHGHRFGGNPNHEALRKAHNSARLIIYGHTHKMVCDQDESPWVANPGAAGATRNHGGPSCIILKASEDRWELTLYRNDDAQHLQVA